MRAKTTIADPAPLRHRRSAGPLPAMGAALLGCTALTTPALAQDSAAEEPAQDIVVTGALDALPLKDVGSVFGFDKTITETPRSASTISAEQIERFGITEIYDLVAQVPGTFTNSFFGVGGALDIRGTPGEVYFRGVRRLDNPGNYPTPIGASERIDIVRGPASVIFGPSKTGGYMNFVPKSARVAGGGLLSEPEGFISYTGGSWSHNDIKASINGPVSLGAQEFGYSLYAEVEDSGSYYRNMDTNQTILQAAFDTDISPFVRIEFGGMYQNYKGQQNGGWNRLTQDLVDNGNYITGAAQPLDTDGDGQISQGEIKAAVPGGLSVFGAFQCGGGVFPSTATDACYTQAPYTALNLINPGTAKLSRKNVLTGPNDKLTNRGSTFYLDITYDDDSGFVLKNQMFYDSYENTNLNSYGFSQIHDAYVFEDKIVASYSKETNAGKFSFQLSPSIRYTDFKHGDDFNYEYFNRVDLTVGYTPASDRLLSYECDCLWTNYNSGYYTDLGIAGLVDLDFEFGLDIIAGVRYDYIEAKSTNDVARLEVAPALVSAKGSQGDWSWTASASYTLPFGVIPYVTASRQTTVVAGQGAEIYADAIAGDAFLSASKLYEAGVKGEFLDKRLFAAVSVYKQKRTDFNIQSITVNQAVETKGLEAEMRWSVDDHLLVTGAYTRTKVFNLTGLEAGSLFGFWGAEDLVNVSDPSLVFGGQPIGLLPIPDRNASRRAGIPTNLYSATATYAFDNGIAINASVAHVESVFSGQSQKVRLPSYTLVDLGASFETGPWLFRVVVKNATDEEYFRANFTELFGGTIVLPERPRNVQATVQYKF